MSPNSPFPYETVESTTLVMPPEKGKKLPRVSMPDDKFGKAATSTAFWSFICVLAVPSIAGVLSLVSIFRAWRTMNKPGQGVRCVGALALGVSTLLFAILFWLLWATMRPTPRALITGWRGLRNLPAVEAGFQHTQQDPFAWSLGSFKKPHL